MALGPNASKPWTSKPEEFRTHLDSIIQSKKKRKSTTMHPFRWCTKINIMHWHENWTLWLVQSNPLSRENVQTQINLFGNQKENEFSYLTITLLDLNFKFTTDVDECPLKLKADTPAGTFHKSPGSFPNMLKFGIQRRKVIGQTIWLLRASGMPIRFVAVGSRFPASAWGNNS